MWHLIVGCNTLNFEPNPHSPENKVIENVKASWMQNLATCDSTTIEQCAIKMCENYLATSCGFLPTYDHTNFALFQTDSKVRLKKKNSRYKVGRIRGVILSDGTQTEIHLSRQTFFCKNSPYSLFPKSL